MAAHSDSPARERRTKRRMDTDVEYYSEERCREREALFLGRGFETPRWCNMEWLAQNGFGTVVAILEEQGLLRFLSFSGPYYPRLVCQFYANFAFRRGRYQTRVLGHQFSVLKDHLRSEFGLDDMGTYAGDTEFEEGEDPIMAVDPGTFFQSILRAGEVWVGGIKNVGKVTAENRILLYLLSYCLIPKTSKNHAQASEDELRLLSVMRDHTRINWGTVVLQRMLTASKSRAPKWLPYPMIVSRLLTVCGVTIPEGEPCIKVPEAKGLISDAHFHQMGLSYHHDSRTWLWKAEYDAMEAAVREDERAEAHAEEEEIRAMEEGVPTQERGRFDGEASGSGTASFDPRAAHAEVMARLDAQEQRLDTMAAQQREILELLRRLHPSSSSDP